MNLEQRLVAVEAELASLKAQSPGGAMYRSEDVTITVGGVEIKPTHAEVKAASSKAAGINHEYSMSVGVNV